LEDFAPVRIVLGRDDVGGFGEPGAVAYKAAVVLVEMILVDGLDVLTDDIDPLDEGSRVDPEKPKRPNPLVFSQARMVGSSL